MIRSHLHGVQFGQVLLTFLHQNIDALREDLVGFGRTGAFDVDWKEEGSG